MLRLPTFEYHRPGSLEEVLRLLEDLGEDAMPVAGGTDLVPNLKHGLREPAHLVSIRRLPELMGVEVADGELRIGAGESLTAVAGHHLVREHTPSLAAAAGAVAGPQLRNAGTLGGNLCLDTRCTYYNQTHFWRQALGYCLKKDGDTCHVTRVGRKCVAAHSADTPPVLMTLGAVVDLASAAGPRSVPVADFFVADGIANTVREPGEILTRVRVPLPRPGTRAAFRKLRQRNAIDFPLLNVAVAVTFAGDGAGSPDGAIVEEIRLVVSALGSRPREVTGLEEVAGGPLDADAVAFVASRAHKQCRPLTNIIVDPAWRRAMVEVEVRRALESLLESRPEG